MEKNKTKRLMPKFICIAKFPVPSCDLFLLPLPLSQNYNIRYIRKGARNNLLFSVSIVRPRWTVEPTDRQFAQGSDAKVDCKADGFPQPSISWKKAVGKSTDSSDFKRLVVWILSGKFKTTQCKKFNSRP